MQGCIGVGTRAARVDVRTGLHERGDRGGGVGEVTGPVGGHVQQGAGPVIVAHAGGRQLGVLGEEFAQGVEIAGLNRVGDGDGERVIGGKHGEAGFRVGRGRYGSMRRGRPVPGAPWLSQRG